MNCPFGELYSLFDFGQLSTSTKVKCDEIRKQPLADTAVSYYPPDCHLRLFDDY